MNEIVGRLKEKGYKMTPQRRAVIQALSECGQFTDASSILDYVRKANPDVGLDTVYRNLRLLISIGVVNQINNPGNDRTIYELNTKPHHHHAVCLLCGKIECIDYCPGDFEKMKSVIKTGFKVVDHSFELFGYCKDCKKLI
jgi:Fe2+ or Zn2+ uptake regulation protein